MKSLLNSWASRTASRRCSAISRISSSVYSPCFFSSMRLRIMRMMASTSTSPDLISKLTGGSPSQGHGQALGGVEDEDHGQGPEKDVDEERPVRQEHVG